MACKYKPVREPMKPWQQEELFSTYESWNKLNNLSLSISENQTLLTSVTIIQNIGTQWK
jgi:hypothetical protein